MISSTSFSSRVRTFSFCILLVVVSGCTGQRNVSLPVLHEPMRIAVLPFDNLSGGKTPVKEMRQLLLQQMKRHGLPCIPDEKMEAFLAKYRIRYTGGINPQVADAVRNELDAETVLITTVELSDAGVNPKIALFSRLVSTGNAVRILWMDSVGLSGDDSPGIFKIGIIEDPRLLQAAALQRLADSLAAYLVSHVGSAAGTGRHGHDRDQNREDDRGYVVRSAAGRGRFAPKVYFQLPFPGGRKCRIAILPFQNETERKGGGEILMLHFARQLVNKRDVEVIEPGAMRQKLIDLRMIMSKGVSLADMDVIADVLDADMILAGKCSRYDDYEGVSGIPRVMFSVLMIERESRKMVWSSASYNEGDNGVLFFDFGKLRTASSLASRMTQAVAELLVQQRQK